MAEGLKINESYTLVNAPAGSGKTTAVSKSIKKLLRNPVKKILCITYTNRAAEQLSMKIDDERAEISTIHSFISSTMTPFFKLKPLIELFVNFYEKKILNILNSKDEYEIESLKRYREKYDLKGDFEVTKNTVLSNISHLEYGETQFSSFLYGKLSHDDLLIFSKFVFEKFPKLNVAISQSYSYVFIDEYQDTKSDILQLFYNATLNSETKLILLGDEMQQIYKDRVEGFQNIINQNFFKDESLRNNWRSQKNIVKVLNNLYFDSSCQQIPQKAEGEKPTIYIVEDPNCVEVQNNTLQLVLLNSHLFSAIGSYNLYDAYKKRYKVFDKYSSKEILSNLTMENPDDLITLLVFITEISNDFNNQQYSKLFQKIADFKFSNKEIWKIKNHLDKMKIERHLSELSKLIKTDITIEKLLNSLLKNEIVNTSYIKMVIENIEVDIEFKQKINSLKIEEFNNCYNEMQNPLFSTQHAVKGEGFDSVALKISDYHNPSVKMYLFLQMFSKDLFNYRELTSINTEINRYTETFHDSIGMKVSELRAAEYTKYKEECETHINNIKKALRVNEKMYEEFFINTFSEFSTKLTVTAFKKCITLINKIDGILIAYKLFYVGCSRAKEKLDVYVSYNDIRKFEEDFINKMESIEFDVIK